MSQFGRFGFFMSESEQNFGFLRTPTYSDVKSLSDMKIDDVQVSDRLRKLTQQEDNDDDDEHHLQLQRQLTSQLRQDASAHIGKLN